MSDEFQEMDFEYDDLFADEFSVDDIIESKSDAEIKEEMAEESEANVIKKAGNADRSKLLNVEDLLNYNEDYRKDKLFRFEWGAEYQVEEDERLKEGFRDFFNVPKISGAQHGHSDSNMIPNEKVQQSQKYIQIKDMPETEINNEDTAHFKGHFSTIIINKNPDEEISGIDVICSCGNRTRIEFDFDGNLSFDTLGNSNVIIKDPSQDPTVLSDIITHHIMESPENYEDDENYNKSLIQELDRIESGGAIDFKDLNLPVVE